MTQTDIREQRSAGPSSEGEEICHIVEHDDPDTALCGKDVTGYPWNPPWPMCVVCVDLDEQGRRKAARPASEKTPGPPAKVGPSVSPTVAAGGDGCERRAGERESPERRRRHVI